jgi:hypothetical protein
VLAEITGGVPGLLKPHQPLLPLLGFAARQRTSHRTCKGFRSFLAARGYARIWPPSRLWLALEIVQRLRYPGQPREVNGQFGEGKLAADTGAEGGGRGDESTRLDPLTSRGQGPVTSKEVKRDFTRKSGQSQRQFLRRCGENLAGRLKALGLPVRIIPASGTTSVYLKHADFEVRITDHRPERGTQVERSGGPRYGLLIKGTTAKASDLTDLLTKIAARHAP